MKQYKIIDLQGGGLFSSKIYTSLLEVEQALKNFHSIDCDNVEKWDLNDCLEIGQWEIQEVIL